MHSSTPSPERTKTKTHGLADCGAASSSRATRVSCLFIPAPFGAHGNDGGQFLVARGLGHARQVPHDGGQAFQVPIPQRVVRIQRREYYRLTLPATNPIHCRIPLQDHATRKVLDVNLVDISVGGIGIIGYPPDVEFDSGLVYRGCRIDLPYIGSINFAMQIRSTFRVTLSGGQPVKRSGCQFVDMPEPTVSQIQRYILQHERERRAREVGD